MSITQKINTVIKQMSAEEIDAVSPEELKQLTQSQVELYIYRARELERKFYWDLASGAGLIPAFGTPPLMVTEEKFRERMHELQVPVDLINSVIKGHPITS